MKCKIAIAAPTAAWVVSVALVIGPPTAAGEMEPWAPPAPTMKPLDLIEPRVPLHAEMFPVIIDTPGSYYLVESTTASAGISIQASDVTLDLNGFTLAGTGVGGGISAVGGLEGITVRNGTVRDWGYQGVYVEPTSSARVEHVVASDNLADGIVVGSGSLVVDCHAEGNGFAGIWAGDDSIVRNSTASGNGLFSAEGAITVGSRSIVESCTANGNGGPGIQIGVESVVIDSSASSNAVHGILGGDQTQVSGSVANANPGFGIFLGHESVIVKSIARANGAVGIVGGSGAIVRDCTAAENLQGITVGNGGQVESCTARGNMGPGIYAGHGSTVRNSSLRENQGHGIFATYGVDVIGNNCSRNGSVVGGDGAGIYVEGVDNRVDGNLVLSNDRGIETALGGNVIVRNSASGNGTDYGAISGGNDVGPTGTAASATSPWANIWF